MKKYNRLGRLLVKALSRVAFTAVVLGSGSAFAAQQYWVSLGSYSELSGAQQMHARALGTFSQLNVVPSESNIGFVYRVLDGPVYSRAEADAKLERARFAGFLDAWLLIKGESFVMPQGLSEAELSAGGGQSYGVQDSTQGVVLGEYSSDYSGDYTSSYDSQGTVSAAEEFSTPTIGEQELVEVAPRGYGVHQLRRGDSISGSPEGESRLRALDDLIRPESSPEPQSAQ